VGLSVRAATERVRRMEDAGIITGYRVARAVDKLGYPITARTVRWTCGSGWRRLRLR
jgi:DNA-binding Lrp family transcriptional regulator